MVVETQLLLLLLGSVQIKPLVDESYRGAYSSSSRDSLQTSQGLLFSFSWENTSLFSLLSVVLIQLNLLMFVIPLYPLVLKMLELYF